MQFSLYNYTGSPIALTKTYALNTALTLTGSMRDILNIEDPVILLEHSGNMNTYNYCHINDLGYYYFMGKPINIRTNMWQIQLHMDYLMSFRSDILKLSGVVGRNEHYYNTMLIDERLRFLGYKEVNTITFPSALKNDESYILAVNGR